MHISGYTCFATLSAPNCFTFCLFTTWSCQYLAFFFCKWEITITIGAILWLILWVLLLSKAFVIRSIYCRFSHPNNAINLYQYSFFCLAKGPGGDMQWCFSQVKGDIDDDVAEGMLWFKMANHVSENIFNKTRLLVGDALQLMWKIWRDPLNVVHQIRFAAINSCSSVIQIFFFMNLKEINTFSNVTF